MASFDFCLLVETFATTFASSSVLFPNHDVFIAAGVRLTDALTARLSGGLILLVKKELSRHVTRVNFEYDNMIAVTIDKVVFGTDTPVVLLGAYLPPSSSQYYVNTEINNGVSILEQCVMDLTEELGDIPIILTGDLNSRTGSNNSEEFDINDIPLHFLENGCDRGSEASRNKHSSKDSIVNEFGKYLLNVCTVFDLTILNGQDNHPDSANFTYVSSTGCSVVDYFIVSKKLLELSPCMSVGQRVDSKHMPIELVLSAQISTCGCQGAPKKFKIEKFVWDNDKSTEFMGNITSVNTEQLISDATDLIDQDIDMSLSKLTEAILAAGSCMKKVITVGKERGQVWFDWECKQSKKTLRHHLRRFCKNGAIENRDLYNDKRREYKELLRQKKMAHRNRLLHSLHDNINTPKEFWGAVKSCLGKKSVYNDITPDEWFAHFQHLFNDPIEQDVPMAGEDPGDQEEEELDIDIDSLECEITEAEVYTALRAIKNGKAAGPDGIIGEFLKHSAITIVPFLVKLFNKLFSSGTYPAGWTEAIIHPLYKKGDPNKADNYRGISLLNILSKVYSHILNNRLNTWIEMQERIGENQAGFRKKRSTVDHIFTLYALIHKQLLYHKKLYVAFIDFKKAFDYVDRDKLWGILRKNGIKSTSKMYRAITSMYNTVKAKVRVGSDVTESFTCPRGVKQGEVCSPVLFTLFIEELAKEVCQRGRHGVQLMPELVQILILMFADDVTLIADSVCGLQTQLNILRQMACNLGLIVNLDKSNIVVFRNGGHLSHNEKWKYGNSVIEVVNVYKYLGIFLSTRMSFSHSLNDMASRAKKGIICILKLLWRLGEKSPSIFFKLFDAQIQPMLTYGAEVWGVETDLKIIEKVHLFALKRFLNVSSRTPNNLVYGETGRYPLSVNILTKSVKFWLRIIKMPQERLPRKTYQMLLFIHQNNKNTWASSICFLLFKYGFAVVWENQGVGNEHLFLKTLKERLCAEFCANWSACLQSSDRYIVYSSLKTRFGLPLYLETVKHVQARTLFIRLRLGVSQIKPHRLRFVRNANDDDLLCPACGEATESEIHFMLVCPAYADIRQELIARKYYRQPSLAKLSQLLASEHKQVLYNLTNYLRKAFEMRAAICTGQI